MPPQLNYPLEKDLEKNRLLMIIEGASAKIIFNLTSGAFTGVVACPPGGGAANWTGLAIDPFSGIFYRFF